MEALEQAWEEGERETLNSPRVTHLMEGPEDSLAAAAAAYALPLHLAASGDLEDLAEEEAVDPLLGGALYLGEAMAILTQALTRPAAAAALGWGAQSLYKMEVSLQSEIA